MKNLLFLLLVCSSFVLHAQTDTTKYYYLKINIKGNIENNAKIKVDFGSDSNVAYPIAQHKEVTSRIETYSNMIDAYNFLSTKGWQHVETVTLAIAGDWGSQMFIVWRKKRY